MERVIIILKENGIGQTLTTLNVLLSLNSKKLKLF